ncbi:MAG: tRNA (N6-isopentenyl adenosine(37)-C2)-methylthiotransferase MiaB [Deltaproteobacteria bacterium]|nr:tRNA (N6-isopentenyl adenosine(37)-C2)-methylthiotransferase MiaB [Deltaproteobacteria bacterium]
MNVHESDQIAALMLQNGYVRTDNPRRADLIIVNTCTIREKAAQKAMSQLGRFRELKRKNPGLIVGVGGCLAQQLGQVMLKKFPHLSLVFGTHSIDRIPALVRSVEATGARFVDTAFRESIVSLGILAFPENGHPSAYVTIMQGCNNFCSYCVVPYVRGREVSRKCEDILTEIKALADRGIKEVVLLGQNVNSYGKTMNEECDFANLVTKIGKINGIERIRFTTSHPKDLSGELIRCFSNVKTLCEHIHLPVQSGSDKILRRMNRKYGREIYMEKVRDLRSACPEISITSDVIVGFPGETDRDFQETIDLMEKIRFDNAYSFLYSERAGTAAMKLDQKVDVCIKRERLHYLQSLQERHTLEKNRTLIGKRQEVLIEGPSKNCQQDATGRTRSNKIVNFEGGIEKKGCMVSVRIKDAYLHSLRGELSQEEVNPC